jgi:hypothetical protein
MKANADTGRNIDLTVKICLAALGLWFSLYHLRGKLARLTE